MNVTLKTDPYSHELLSAGRVREFNLWEQQETLRITGTELSSTLLEGRGRKV